MCTKGNLKPVLAFLTRAQQKLYQDLLLFGTPCCDSFNQSGLLHYAEKMLIFISDKDDKKADLINFSTGRNEITYFRIRLLSMQGENPCYLIFADDIS